MTTKSIANPFYHQRKETESLPDMARLPKAPINGSPVPHLTSLYHNSDPGDYGSRAYPGNCGGNLIKDLLRYFDAKTVFDPMSGSGTCRDVCDDLNVSCASGDIHKGFDLADEKQVSEFVSASQHSAFEFIWIHPPYWRQKLYAADSRDLSRAPTLGEFLDRYAAVIRNCSQFLAPDGHLAVLMGDYCDREAGFVPLTWHTKELAFASGLQQACTDIIRFSHGASSSKKVYRSSFIPGLHDVCMVFNRR